MRRRLAALGAALATLAAAACASSGGSTEPPPLPSPGAAAEPVTPAAPFVLAASDLLERSRVEQEAGEFARADSTLLRVWDTCGESPAGARALLLLAGLRLDPRNDAASPETAAHAAASYLALAGTPAWSRPLARQLYLLALELGAPPIDAPLVADPGPAVLPDSTEVATDSVPTARADGHPASAVLPPRACGVRESTGGRLAGGALPELGDESMASRVTRLQEQIAALQRELDRIRKTIHP